MGLHIRFHLALSLTLASAAIGQAPRPTDRDGGEIVVEGRRLTRRDIAKSAGSISRPESTGGFETQYPRWVGSICVSVAGFPRANGQFIADRIGEVARSLALQAGQPGCSPNIVIVATDQPSNLIARLRIKRADLITGQDTAVIRRVQNSHDAVRLLGATSIAGSSGEAPRSTGVGGGSRTVPETQSYDGGSRLIARTQTVLVRETVVVDSRMIDGISYEQLADYLTFVTLAQLNPQATIPGVASILSLLPKGSIAPPGLTKFDRAYLQGLYRSPVDATGIVQKNTIETTVDRALRPRTEPTEANAATGDRP